MSDKNKVLILSLGVGSTLEDENGKQFIADSTAPEMAFAKLLRGEYKYRQGKYYLDIGAKPKESPFVGEVLLEEFKPNQLVVIGTIKSMWDAFYFRFSQEEEESKRKKHFLQLWKIVNENQGHKTGSESLEKAQEEIETILEGIKERLGLSGIKVILMEYGPGAKADSNYARMRQIRQVFSDKVVNDVAFDITHSFRSIPFYNLTVLNYLKTLGTYRIEVSKVYYGNLDISRELEGKAPIEDLSYLTDVLDMANAVTSFRITGNAGILIDKLLKIEGDGKIIEALKKYEWATETNNFNGIIGAIDELYQYEDNQQGSVMTGDACRMIVNVLKTHFSVTLLSEANSSIEGKANLQYELAVWYYGQRKYGVFLATAQEAIRSYLLPLYCEKKKEDISDTENKRKAAMSELTYQKERIKGAHGMGDAGELIKKMALQQQEVRRIRNIFAHCLEEKNPSIENGIGDLQVIKEYYNTLVLFHTYMQESSKKKQFVNAFNYENKKIGARSCSGRGFRVIVGEKDYPFSDSEIKKFRYSNSKEYDVCQLSRADLEEISRHKSTRGKRSQRALKVLELVRKEKEEGRKQCFIIFYKMKLSSVIGICMELALRMTEGEAKIFYYVEKKQSMDFEKTNNPYYEVTLPKMQVEEE